MSGCYTRDKLTQLFDGKLPSKQDAEFSSHLERCSACRRLATQLLAERHQYQSSVATSLQPVPAAGVEGIRKEATVVGGGPFPNPEAEKCDELFSAVLDRKLLSQSWDPLESLPAEDDTPTNPLPELPGFQLIRELGRGGMGVVYLAEQTDLNRRVAIKMLLGGVFSDAEALVRFRAESRVLAEVQHPNLVQIFQIGDYNGSAYCVMEYVNGGGLDHWIAGKPQDPRAAGRLVASVAWAVQAAHEKGFIHRDLKPANILLSAPQLSNRSTTTRTLDQFIPKVTDFGLAKKIDESGMTCTGIVLGTPSYMAPEQAMGRSKEVGPRADVWALGAILYELLTGRPPFLGSTGAETIGMVIASEPVPVRQLATRVPRDLETIVQKCLQKDPRRRYSTAAELASDLERFREGRPVKARPVGAVIRAWRWVKRNPVALALSSLMTLALIAGLAYFVWLNASYRSSLAEQRKLQKELSEYYTDAIREANSAVTPVARGSALLRLAYIQKLRGASTARATLRDALDTLNSLTDTPLDTPDVRRWREQARQQLEAWE